MKEEAVNRIAGSLLSFAGLGVTIFGVYRFSEPAGIVVSGIILLAVGSALIDKNGNN
jgi:small neutral amino acid transporter SnatA (MarC family)